MSSADNFANSLDPDQNFRPDLDPNCLTDGIPEEIFEKLNLKKKSADNKNAGKKFPEAKELSLCYLITVRCSFGCINNSLLTIMNHG